MRALWIVRENLTQHPGGDTTQILRTADALRARGVEVELSSESAAPLAGCDVVHLFHLDRLWENEAHCRRIRAAGRPAVLSTIYWPPDEFDRGGRAGVQGRLARLAGSRTYENLRLFQRWVLHVARHPSAAALRARRWGFHDAARHVLETAAVILPNSRAEQDAIRQHFGVDRPTVVVPNAADASAFDAPSSDAPPERAGVLCVGRIEPRKNQLALIEALNPAGTPLTLVGQPGRYSHTYYRRCLRAAGPNVTFLGQQRPRALGDLYRRARVHACVSWYETPGLASLEAALCGCNLVITPGGSTREYFGDNAHYCTPNDVASIRRAVEAALAAPPPARLTERVRTEYTWSAAAEKTLEAYQLAASGGQ
ncbi:MAG: glycosyltransferase family 4 protein [Phycisphaerae bacterium]|jgi:glycosyltransferase involved in cell wall biosynthesis